MKILFVTNMYPTPEMPAYGTFVKHQAEQLSQLGHTVDIVNILGFESKLNYLKGAVEVFRRTQGVRYDVVHAHYGHTAFSAWFRVQAPLVVTFHGSDVFKNSFQGFCSKVIARFSNAVIVVSEEMGQRVPGIVIPCGVDLTIFKPYSRNQARDRLGWPLDKYIVLFPFDPGRRVKRYDLAKAAVERLQKKGIRVELVATSGIENREMPWHYSAADVMLLCSDWEGSPTSVKEAMACDVPVVATDVGDVRQILSGVIGTRLCTHEVTDIAYNIRALLDEPRNGQFERRAAMMRYDQALTVKKIIGVYANVLSENKAGRRQSHADQSDRSAQ